MQLSFQSLFNQRPAIAMGQPTQGISPTNPLSQATPVGGAKGDFFQLRFSGASGKTALVQEKYALLNGLSQLAQTAPGGFDSSWFETLRGADFNKPRSFYDEGGLLLSEQIELMGKMVQTPQDAKALLEILAPGVTSGDPSVRVKNEAIVKVSGDLLKRFPQELGETLVPFLVNQMRPTDYHTRISNTLERDKATDALGKAAENPELWALMKTPLLELYAAEQDRHHVNDVQKSILEIFGEAVRYDHAKADVLPELTSKTGTQVHHVFDRGLIDKALQDPEADASLKELLEDGFGWSHTYPGALNQLQQILQKAPERLADYKDKVFEPLSLFREYYHRMDDGYLLATALETMAVVAGRPEYREEVTRAMADFVRDYAEKVKEGVIYEGFRDRINPAVTEVLVEILPYPGVLKALGQSFQEMIDVLAAERNWEQHAERLQARLFAAAAKQPENADAIKDGIRKLLTRYDFEPGPLEQIVAHLKDALVNPEYASLFVSELADRVRDFATDGHFAPGIEAVSQQLQANPAQWNEYRENIRKAWQAILETAAEGKQQFGGGEDLSRNAVSLLELSTKLSAHKPVWEDTKTLIRNTYDTEFDTYRLFNREPGDTLPRSLSIQAFLAFAAQPHTWPEVGQDLQKALLESSSSRLRKDTAEGIAKLLNQPQVAPQVEAWLDTLPPATTEQDKANRLVINIARLERDIRQSGGLNDDLTQRLAEISTEVKPLLQNLLSA